MIKKIFQDLCSNIEISHNGKLIIQKHKKEITSVIDKYFENKLATKKSKFIGSYGRNTAIFTENIRLLVVMPEQMYWQLSMGISDILAEMKKALTKKYLSCEHSDNGNGLNINLNGDLSFEIVPGFIFDNGTYIYLCGSQWKKLNLNKEHNNFYNLNMKYNNNLVELCRILKLWKNNRNVDINNILLDTLAYYFFYYKKDEKRYSYETYDEMLVDFFRYLFQNCKKDSFISFDGETVLPQKIDLYDEAFFCVTTAQTALVSADCGMTREAILDWQKILGYSILSNI